MAKGWKLSTEHKLQRFLDKVNKSTGCWEWNGFLNSGGYGRYKWNQRNWLAHRLMWMITYGELDPLLDVCHTCDNRKCVNPEHLFLGTHTDNMQDMLDKGRSNYPKGERSGKSKLTEKAVELIRKASKEGITQTELGNLFGVAHTTIGRVLRSETWKNN